MPSGAEMSTPKWNWNDPSLVMTPSVVGGAKKSVRGSPKPPRIGCCRLNGLTGQPYAEVALEVDSAAAVVGRVRDVATAQVARAAATSRLVALRLICAVSVDMAPRSGAVQSAHSRPAHGSLMGPNRRVSGLLAAVPIVRAPLVNAGVRCYKKP